MTESKKRVRCTTRMCLLLSWAVGGCAGHEQSIDYKLYPGPLRDDSELASIRSGIGTHEIRVDGLVYSPADYRAVKVLPGEHTIEWHGNFYATEDYEVSDLYTKSIRITVNLRKGATYHLRADHRIAPELRRMFWIRIEETGAILIFGRG